MQTARVIGNATATVRHPSLEGWRLLILQPLDIRGEADESPVIAIDHLGARRGDLVFFTSDTREIQRLTGRIDSPVRLSIQGIIDAEPE